MTIAMVGMDQRGGLREFGTKRGERKDTVPDVLGDDYCDRLVPFPSFRGETGDTDPRSSPPPRLLRPPQHRCKQLTIKGTVQQKVHMYKTTPTSI